MLPACSASAGALQSSHARRWPRGRRCPLAAASRWAMAAAQLHRRGVALVGRRCLPPGFPRVCDWGIGIESEGETDRRERQAAGEIELEATRDDVGAEWAVDSSQLGYGFAATARRPMDLLVSDIVQMSRT